MRVQEYTEVGNDDGSIWYNWHTVLSLLDPCDTKAGDSPLPVPEWTHSAIKIWSNLGRWRAQRLGKKLIVESMEKTTEPAH